MTFDLNRSGGYLTREDMQRAFTGLAEAATAEEARRNEILERWGVRYPAAFRLTLSEDDQLYLSVVLHARLSGAVFHPKDAAVVNDRLAQFDRLKAAWSGV